MEDYEKKYKEALEIAREAYETYEIAGQKKVLEDIFPELKESEDERVRKGIIGYIDHNQHYGVSKSEMITWLEKQKPVEWSEEDEYVYNKIIEDYVVTSRPYREGKLTWLKSLKQRIAKK